MVLKRAGIVGDWVHAHERDVDGGRVFVPSNEKLPPSRGRQRLIFRSDGSFVENGAGPNDRMVEAEGMYQFDGAKLVLHRTVGGARTVYEARLDAPGKKLQLKREDE